MHGLILVDKPLNWTSFDVVAKIRGVIKAKTGERVKVGHSGTLDPLATGLLVVAIGSYTKKLPDLIKQDKSYEAKMCLGKTSNTGDAEGELTEISNVKPSKPQILHTIAKFVGDITQVPPRFSAKKINGRRAYDLARAGQQFKIEPRAVRVQSIALKAYNYPILRLETVVSSGTYIRSLSEDIGNELGCGAYIQALRRTKIGKFKVDDAIQLDNINYAKLSEHVLTLDK
ncbi:MAG: tRNA pseudouridine(55) synthase TruB [Candidatus Saccharibacteria bacterium]